jgi:hypothetical protein
LHAVRALVAAVAELPLALLRHVALKVRAGQVVQPHVEAGIEQALPASGEEVEKRRLVGQQLVQAAVQRVLLRHRTILAQQIRLRRPVEPLPVQAPFAARLQQALAHQDLQPVQPARALAAAPQLLRPETVQGQPIPQRQRQPTASPLPGTAQAQFVEPDLDDLAVQLRRGAVGIEQRELPGAWACRIQHLNALAPGRLPAIVDLPQIQDLALHYAAPRRAAVLHDAPVAMFLAVFETALVT